MDFETNQINYIINPYKVVKQDNIQIKWVYSIYYLSNPKDRKTSNPLVNIDAMYSCLLEIKFNLISQS
jgi:hypothetical protein